MRLHQHGVATRLASTPCAIAAQSLVSGPNTAWRPRTGFPIGRHWERSSPGSQHSLAQPRAGRGHQGPSASDQPVPKASPEPHQPGRWPWAPARLVDGGPGWRMHVTRRGFLSLAPLTAAGVARLPRVLVPTRNTASAHTLVLACWVVRLE